MRLKRLEHFAVYLDEGTASAVRTAARLRSTSISSFLKLTVEQGLAPENDRERHIRLLEYIVLQNNKTLDHHNPEYKKQVLAQHQERYKRGQSNAD